MFSAGLPMLYPIALLNFVILYWVYKGLLVKFYKKTVAFNQGLLYSGIRYLKFAIWFHLVMSCLMYTNHGLLTSDLLDNYAGDLRRQLLSNVQDRSGAAALFFARFLTPIGLVYIIFAILVLLGGFLKKTLIKLLGALCEACCKKSEKQIEAEKIVKAAQGLDVFSEDYIGDVRVPPLCDLYKRSLEEYKRAEALSIGDFPPLTDNDYFNFCKEAVGARMKVRINTIKNKIDKYLNIII